MLGEDGYKLTSKELSTTTVFHAKIEVIFRLKRMVQGHYEGVIACGQDFLLGQGSLDLIPLNHLLLAQNCRQEISASSL
jgi:hypothetical protein